MRDLLKISVIIALLSFIYYKLIYGKGVVYCIGNKCTYKTLIKTYEAKYINYNGSGEKSFFGKYKFWYFLDNNVWKLIPNYNNMEDVERLKIPKEVKNNVD